MVELTRQNQELNREIGLKRKRHGRYTEGQAQSQEGGAENAVPKDHSRGTTLQRVLHLEREMDKMRKAINEMRENMRRANPVDDLVHRIDSPFTASINGRPLPPKFKMPSRIHMMEHSTYVIIL